MDKVELVCRAISDFHGRLPDYSRHGVPSWKRYEALAQTILNALAEEWHIPIAKPDDFSHEELRDQYAVTVNAEEDHYYGC